MKEVNLQTTYKPLALVIQIEPTSGTIGETTLVTQASVAGHEFRHDLWWRDVPDEVRGRIQELVDCALDVVLHEDAIHDLSKSKYETEQAKAEKSRENPQPGFDVNEDHGHSH